MYCQGYDRQEDCIIHRSHRLYITIAWNRIHHLDPSCGCHATFISDGATVSTEDQTFPAPSGSREDPLHEVYSTAHDAFRLGDFRQP